MCGDLEIYVSKPRWMGEKGTKLAVVVLPSVVAGVTVVVVVTIEGYTERQLHAAVIDAAGYVTLHVELLLAAMIRRALGLLDVG